MNEDYSGLKIVDPYTELGEENISCRLPFAVRPVTNSHILAASDISAPAEGRMRFYSVTDVPIRGDHTKEGIFASQTNFVVPTEVSELYAMMAFVFTNYPNGVGEYQDIIGEINEFARMEAVEIGTKSRIIYYDKGIGKKECNDYENLCGMLEADLDAYGITDKINFLAQKLGIEKRSLPRTAPHITLQEGRDTKYKETGISSMLERFKSSWPTRVHDMIENREWMKRIDDANSVICDENIPRCGHYENAADPVEIGIPMGGGEPYCAGPMLGTSRGPSAAKGIFPAHRIEKPSQAPSIIINDSVINGSNIELNVAIEKVNAEHLYLDGPNTSFRFALIAGLTGQFPSYEKIEHLYAIGMDDRIYLEEQKFNCRQAGEKIKIFYEVGPDSRRKASIIEPMDAKRKLDIVMRTRAIVCR